MSTLTLVRHGQAAPFQRESDVLSELGEQQARVLARHWLSLETTFDEVYTGTLVRQQRTEAIVAEEYARAGVAWPQAQSTAAWNEYDAVGVLERLVPAMASRDEGFAEMVRNFEAARETVDANKHFQRMFEVAMLLWVDGVMEMDGVEPFHTFEHRVATALKAVTAQPGSRSVAVFTSGGPIGLAVQRVVEAPPRNFLNINWRVKNCSVTEFIFGAARISLDSFNDTGHLPRGIRSFR